MTMATAGGLFTHGSSIIYRVIRRVMQGCLSLVCSGIVKSKGLAEGEQGATVFTISLCTIADYSHTFRRCERRT